MIIGTLAIWEEKCPITFYSHLEQMRGNPAETYSRSMISSGFHTHRGGRSALEHLEIEPRQPLGVDEEVALDDLPVLDCERSDRERPAVSF